MSWPNANVKYYNAFSKDEKNPAKRLNYYSLSAYRHLHKAGLKLPVPSSVQEWIDEYDVKPWFNNVIYNQLKEKLQQLSPDEKICGLKWDDFSIKKCEEYLKKPWSHPISYFSIDKSEKGDVIADLVKCCLSKLVECGADVRLLTCDQAPRHENIVWKISCTTTQEKPFFEYEGRRYFHSFDFPHLIKNITGATAKAPIFM